MQLIVKPENKNKNNVDCAYGDLIGEVMVINTIEYLITKSLITLRFLFISRL